jgi:hypothetical protein
MTEHSDFLRDYKANGLVISHCLYCSILIAAAPTIEKIEFLENLHDCECKRDFYEIVSE